MSRSELLRSLFDASGKGLEIGPSFNPLLRKADGYDVEIVDHLSAEGLREKYRDANVDITLIEEVDYVSDGGQISNLVGKLHIFDFCVALHVIEHTVDLIGFLIDCQNLLKEDGVLVLAVPDKRYSFDVLRPTCTTGDVIQAHVERRKVHSVGKMFDEFAYNSLRAGSLAWDRNDAGELKFFRALDDARAVFSHVQSSHEFIDIHAWQFTPSSFRLMVHDLNQFGFIQLKEKAFLDVGEGEFYTTLSCDGSGCAVDRLSLAKLSISEQAKIPT